MIKVLCGGKFNLIHKGHLFFLREAKKLGELVVVIANDSHNKKPYARPQGDRKKAVEELHIADKVIIGKPDSFVATVKEEKPQIIALGYDQILPEDCVGYAKKHKIKVIKIARHGNYSTSELLYKSGNPNNRSDSMANAPFILSLIGGLLILVQGLATLAIGATLASAVPGAGAVTGLLGALSAVVIIFALLVLFGAWKMNKGDMRTGGIIVLVFSIVGLLGGGGLVIGSILGIIGGILALTQKK
ncbi:MAG: adenylyltransferase/cytidyltransferase family protein [Candidatus Aenigmarchaeota archaeon]|nr:adenylyltransferase/cytidyltransferase family protein [Candidatus Aenigmarchaeota archaeon]